MPVFLNDRTYSVDANLQVSDDATAYAASQYATVGGVPTFVDLQGNQSLSPAQQARIDAVMVCHVTQIAVSGNQTYKLMVLVSNDPNFGPGNVEQAGEIMLGVGASRDGVNMLTSQTGRYEIMFSNQVSGVIYEWAALYLLIGGTSPSINVEAFIAPLPEV
jgi:hypothetical protein